MKFTIVLPVDIDLDEFADKTGEDLSTADLVEFTTRALNHDVEAREQVFDVLAEEFGEDDK